MKILALGDTHGRNDWEKIVYKEKYDKIIFLGDYFDSKEKIKIEEQKSNFLNIISFKKNNYDSVILLIGNHDFHYLDNVSENYSQYQHKNCKLINKLLQESLEENLLQICYIYKDIAFTHAGITKTWCKNNEIDMNFIEKSVNDLFLKYKSRFMFTPGKNFSHFGDDVEQSPLWVRPNSLLLDKIENFYQVVGHTMMNTLLYEDCVYFVDTMGTTKEYLVIDNGKFIINKHM